MEKSNVIAALGALAQETRLAIFRLLVECGPEGLPAGEVGNRLGLPSPTLSFHLNQLRHARLVAARRRGRSIIYMANYATMNGLLAYLTENCCRGQASCGESEAGELGHDSPGKKRGVASSVSRQRRTAAGRSMS
jgi:ArsR family transcriptional regulator